MDRWVLGSELWSWMTNDDVGKVAFTPSSFEAGSLWAWRVTGAAMCSFAGVCRFPFMQFVPWQLQAEDANSLEDAEEDAVLKEGPLDAEQFCRALVPPVQCPEDCANVTRIYSACPGTRADGGDLGEVESGQMHSAIEGALFDSELELGCPLWPVQTDAGFHLLMARPVSFCLAEEAQDRKGGEHKSRPSSGSASSNDSKDSNDNIAAANSESSTCLPDDHIVQLQTELGRRAAKLGELETEVAELRSANDLLRRECQLSDCKVDQLLSENDLLRRECHDSNCKLQVDMSLRKWQCRTLQISNKRLREECQDTKQHLKEAVDLNAALQSKLQLAETRLKEKLCPASAAPFCVDAAPTLLSDAPEVDGILACHLTPRQPTSPRAFLNRAELVDWYVETASKKAWRAGLPGHTAACVE
ncbi:unnamed protein product [Symbiodinium natans]|uniref:PpiC domain-containing protein n=1 Tax=Symbiodinium natans TaxID=878477 RepID=A0A812RBG5_9DINO|nr:unnamed protein product [Symbiodinium natans]